MNSLVLLVHFQDYFPFLNTDVPPGFRFSLLLTCCWWNSQEETQFHLILAISSLYFLKGRPQGLPAVRLKFDGGHLVSSSTPPLLVMCLEFCSYSAAAAKSLQSRPTLCDPRTAAPQAPHSSDGHLIVSCSVTCISYNVTYVMTF